MMGDGVNTEVSMDSRPNSLVNEQIFTLRLITNKLENAYNGMDVEWDGNKSHRYNSIDWIDWIFRHFQIHGPTEAEVVPATVPAPESTWKKMMMRI